ncbi:hypothetical protein LJC63_05830 [Ruminococcaceae bacterium OttesenSCG-928-L11]|nr:hypothetical protein [Ruminococcaceae bacterium OttesenSCG-928-L11]
MITKEVLHHLPSKTTVELSVDKELTKQRFADDYKACSNTQKNDMIMLANISEAVFLNVCRTGAIKIRPLAVLAYFANVSPYWYTGEAEEKEAYTDELMWNFFCDHDLVYLVRQFKPESIYDPELPEKMKQTAIEQLDKEKALTLLEALYLQAPHSSRANERLTEILKILAWID